MMLRRRFLFAKKAVASGISDNEIWYTTTDDNVLQASSDSTFSTSLVSNVMSADGKGILTYEIVELTEISMKMFSKCDSLTTVTIPDTITSIGHYAFDDCDNLEYVNIPDGVKSFGVGAFRYCYALKEITIPENITTITTYTFWGCSSLTRITLPSILTSIGESAFRQCSGLTSIVIPNSVTSIAAEAFANCTALKGVYITDLEAWCKISFAGYRSNPLYYAYNLYLNGSLVTNLVIPDSITTIKPYAFRACRSITSVTLPSSLTSIGDYGFMACSNLQNVEIPDGVTSVGGSSFENCTSMSEVTIGSGSTSIGTNSFKGCTSLAKIYSRATTPPTVQSNTFESVPTTCVVYVPSASVSAYQSATYWSNFTIQGYNF